MSDPLEHLARMLPESNDAECPNNMNAQRPQLELSNCLHDGPAAALEKCLPGEALKRGGPCKSDFVAD